MSAANGHNSRATFFPTMIRQLVEWGCRFNRDENGGFSLGREGGHTAVLCGRNAVQVTPAGGHRLDLAALAARLGPAVSPRCNEYMLRFCVPGHEITIFPDGRAIVKGTSDPAAARSLY